MIYLIGYIIAVCYFYYICPRQYQPVDAMLDCVIIGFLGLI